MIHVDVRVPWDKGLWSEFQDTLLYIDVCYSLVITRGSHVLTLPRT